VTSKMTVANTPSVAVNGRISPSVAFLGGGGGAGLPKDLKDFNTPLLAEPTDFRTVWGVIGGRFAPSWLPFLEFGTPPPFLRFSTSPPLLEFKAPLFEFKSTFFKTSFEFKRPPRSRKFDEPSQSDAVGHKNTQHMYVCMCVCVCVNIYIRYIYVCIYIIHIYIYIYVSYIYIYIYILCIYIYILCVCVYIYCVYIYCIYI
jgi:hypothetical protein